METKEEVLARVSTHLNLRKARRNVEVERENPEKIVEELKGKGECKPQHFENVTLFFSDFVR